MIDEKRSRMHPSPNVVVVGSINMDLTSYTPQLPAPGETVLGSRFVESPGGKGSNQAIAASRAGGAVSMIGALGSDTFADTLESTLIDAAVDTSLVRRTAGSSGVAVITVDSSAENTIVVISGANATLLGLTEDDRAVIAEAAIVVAQLEVPLETVIEAAQAAADAGVPFLLNPSPVRPLPGKLLDLITLLIVNEGEAASLGAEAIGRVPHVVTTLGPRGAIYRGPDQRILEALAPSVDSIDTTGAGDAFTGALAVAWANQSDVEMALRRACVAGALSTTVYGATPSSPTSTAVDRVLAELDQRIRA